MQTLPMSAKELNAIRNECRSMATKRAAIAGTTSALPMPGLDIAVDVGVLYDLINSINYKFGLTPEQIEQLNPKQKQSIYMAISNVGAQMVGKVVTKQAVTQVLKKMGARMAAKSVAKYVPFIGQVASGAIGFAAMKAIGNAHIEDCYSIVQSAQRA